MLVSLPRTGDKDRQQSKRLVALESLVCSTLELKSSTSRTFVKPGRTERHVKTPNPRSKSLSCIARFNRVRPPSIEDTDSVLAMDSARCQANIIWWPSGNAHQDGVSQIRITSAAA